MNGQMGSMTRTGCFHFSRDTSIEKSILCLLVLLATVSSIPAFSQQNQDAVLDLSEFLGKTVRVETIGGGTFQGELLNAQEDRIELLNGDGIILQISRTRIKSVLQIRLPKQTNLYFQDAAANRLIIIPTGFGMEENEFHVADIEIIGVTSSYGLSRNFSVWGGVSIPGAVFNARFSFTFADDLIGASVGTFLGVNFMGPTTGLFIPYVIASFGSEDRNITAGAGGAFTLSTLSASFFDFLSFVVVVGGKIPFTSTVALVTENWIILPYYNYPNPWGPQGFLIPAIVLRIAGNRLSWDIGATYPLTIDPSGIRSSLGFPIPILALTYRIN